MSIPRTNEYLPPIHPGEMLQEEFMVPLGITAEKLADALHLPVMQIRGLVEKQDGLTGEVALRLGRYFSMTPEFWMNLQKSYELSLARDTVGAVVECEVVPALRDVSSGELIPMSEGAATQASHA